jgi:hypothetical protein
MNDFRSNWNEPFSPLAPAIKPKQEAVPACPFREFEEVTRDEPSEAKSSITTPPQSFDELVAYYRRQMGWK